MDKITQQYVKRYHAVSPMVMRSLRRVGRSIWGRNFLWYRKYYLTKRSGRWVLSDGKFDPFNPNSLPHNLLEVSLRDTNFKIRIARIRGTSVDQAVSSTGHSERELMEHLQRMSAVFRQAEVATGDAQAGQDGRAGGDVTSPVAGTGRPESPGT
jgi:hypothetical protein